MTKITCIVKDNYPGYHDPLIYTVDVANPSDQAEVLAAVTAERLNDLGGSGDDHHDLDLELMFAFEGNLTPVADWRE
jgi:hypothetical protein